MAFPWAEGLPLAGCLRSWVSRVTPFYTRPQVSPATPYYPCGEAICGKPQQAQGKVKNVGKGLRESYIFPFAVLSERQQRECPWGAR